MGVLAPLPKHSLSNPQASNTELQLCAIKPLRLQKIFSDNSATEMKILAGEAKKSNLAITASLGEL